METPKKIGKYEISGRIAAGGFGVIFKGWDPFIRRPVAIKMCANADQEVRERFQREAQFVGNLVHRNITLVFDFGMEGDVPYIVQEFLTGYDLDELLRSGVLAEELAVVSILLQVCDGLEFAHQRGIIHRDIKPSNVRVLEDGTVKIMDFGIAKSLEGGSKLTQTGIALGTSGYLAPEQISGATADARTDIFALGVVAYELITGRRPFEGASISNVLYRIISDNPTPPSQLNAACSATMEGIIQRCLAKDPSQRFQSARELADALRNLSFTREAQAEESPTERTTSVLRGVMSQLDQEIAAAQARGSASPAGSASVQEPTRHSTPDHAILDRPPEMTEDHERRRRPPVLLLFLVMLLVILGGAAATYFSPAVQGLVFPGGAPWVPTPTPTPTPTPVPTATPTPTATPAPEATPTPTGPISVRLVVDPATADVTVNGEPVPGGKTPVRNVALPPGLHTFTISMADVAPKRVKKLVGPTTQTISLSLEVGLLTLLVDPTAPPGAVAYLDGDALGPLPLIRRKVPAGEHELVVRWGDGGGTFRETINVPRLPADPLQKTVAPGG
jgi:serine/threonine-protein kinase